MAIATSSHREHPRVISLLTDPKVQSIFAIIALSITIIYIASFYFYAPNDGIRLHAGYGGKVFGVMEGRPAEDAGILPGDLILTIDGQPVDQWLRRPLYRQGTGAGDRVIYEIQRGDNILTIAAEMKSYLDNWDDFVVAIGVQFLTIIFWLIGVILCLFAPAHDVRSRLIGLVWLLSSIAVASGGPGILSRFWGASTTMEISWGVLAPVLVTAHLYFPGPNFSAQTRRRSIWMLSAIALFLSAVDLVENLILIPRGFSLTQRGIPTYELIYGFMVLSALTSVGLLLRNYIQVKDPDVKRQVGIILWGTALGLGPFLLLSVLPLLFFGTEFVNGSVTVLLLVLIPMAYVYVINQRRLLRVDFFINRALVFFLLVLLVFIISILIFGLLALMLDLPQEMPLIGGIVATIVALPSAAVQTKIQIGVNRVLYGSHYDFSTITSSLSSQLARTLDRAKLVELLTQRLSTQMGIEKAVLFLVDGERITLQNTQSEPFSASMDDELCNFLLEAQTPVHAQRLWGLVSSTTEKHWRKYTWAQLIVPLIFESRLQGILFLGPRITGDVYSDQDIHIVATVAHQGALASANVQLVETLRGLTQRLVRSDEEHRKKVARDLHDSVLQNLFFIKQRLLQDPSQEELADHLDNAIGQLRQTIKTQRSTLLDQGLWLALQDLVADAQKLAGERPIISWQRNVKIRPRFSDEQATSIYRIAQEALYNALKHSYAEYINVKIEHDPNGVMRLSIEDDGIGLSISEHVRMEGPHYGLLGMRERALMIGAELHITSYSGEGTTVTLEFES